MNSLFYWVISVISIFAEPSQVAKLKEQSKLENKHIAVYFSGSDWCKYCLLFKSETMEQHDVKSLLDSNFIYYLADFPQHKKLEKHVQENNDFLAEKLNPSGVFPLLVIADADLNVKAQITKKDSKHITLEQLRKLQSTKP